LNPFEKWNRTPQEYVPVSKMNYSKSFFFRQTLIFPISLFLSLLPAWIFLCFHKTDKKVLFLYLFHQIKNTLIR